MNNTKRSAQPLNTVLNILFWLLIARGVFAVGYHCMKLYALFTDPAALSAESYYDVTLIAVRREKSLRFLGGFSLFLHQFLFF